MNITVCIGSSCHLKGSRQVVDRLERLILEHGLKEKIALCGSFCMGKCQTGVSVLLDGAYHSLTPESTERFFLQNVLLRLPHEGDSTADTETGISNLVESSAAPDGARLEEMNDRGTDKG